MSAIQVDTTRLPLLLHDLRLPAIARLWPEFSERADKEGWPAARFLSALAELEIAERGRRRTERNLAEAHLLPDKTLDNLDFSVVPMLSKARVMALAAGDTWLDKATNLLTPGIFFLQLMGQTSRYWEKLITLFLTVLLPLCLFARKTLNMQVQPFPYTTRAEPMAGSPTFTVMILTGMA